ncbi:hypothetical protein [Methanogenium sp. MK-MG]|uniref:hypothetical protein n=1 Tax=Methanogenium sp. MK-MG TaxID=2599926 RepID=UPI0013EA9617|nr:hypothetical protein [Methanogenium sp. MK-MG]KAF1073524.1 hypothetical protein MKMG_02140 [Methanogenium sp. MK-MG]
MRKSLSILSAALLVIFFAAAIITAGCTDNSATTNVTPTPEATAEMTPEATANVTAAPTEATPSATAVPTEEPKTTVSGEGSQNATVELSKGVHLFTLVQGAPVESTVSVMTEKDGISVKNVYNATVSAQSMKDGKYYWSQAFMLEEAANATVQVETTGNWTLDFAFPQQINGIVPQTFTGAANKATPFFQINEGTYNFSITAANNDVVGVHLMDYDGNVIMDGDRQMPLAFHHGAYDDVVTMKINESNNYLFNVICDGNWTVSVAEA